MKQKINSVLRLIYHTLKGDSLYILKRRGLVVGERFFHGAARIDTCFPNLITIGNDVTLAGSNVTILAHDGSTKRFLNYTRIGRVIIGDKVFIGAGSTVLPGVTIGDNVVIGAGSVVANDIPADSVAMGNPARVKCSIEEFLIKRRREMEMFPLFSTRPGREKLSEIDKFAYVP